MSFVPARPRVTSVILTIAFLAFVPIAYAKAPSKTLQVDCSKGQKINDALGDQEAEELVVEFSGICQEDVLIARRNVTLRGSAPGAMIVGAPGADPRQPGIRMRGVQNVTLEDFAVQDSDSRGIQINHSAAVTLDSLVVNDNPRGGVILLEGSSVAIRDSSFDNNGVDGIGVWENSGLHVQGAISASGNTRVGWIISGGSALSVDTAGGQFRADNNGLVGYHLQLTATAQWGAANPVSVSASGNVFNGAAAILGSSWGGPPLTVSGSEICLELSESVFDGAVNASGCAFGVHASLNSILFLRANTVIGGNDVGVFLDTATAQINNSTITGNTAQDVHLEFGTRASFGGVNQVGTVFCDDTVLVRGNVTCTNPLAPSTQNRTTSAVRERSVLPLSQEP